MLPPGTSTEYARLPSLVESKKYIILGIHWCNATMQLFSSTTIQHSIAQYVLVSSKPFASRIHSCVAFTSILAVNHHLMLTKCMSVQYYASVLYIFTRKIKHNSPNSHLSHICAVITLKSMKYKGCDNLFRISRVEYGIHE